jgi:hypothetical protein
MRRKAALLCRKKTGLFRGSAPLRPLRGSRLRRAPSDPLRGRKPSAFALGVLLRKTPGAASPSGFDFAEFRFAKLLGGLGGVWGKPQTPKTKTHGVLVPLALLKNGKGRSKAAR